MKNSPKFITDALKGEFNIVYLDVDLEKMITNRGLKIHSWGRINHDSRSKKEIYEFNNDDEAARIVSNLINEKSLSGEVEVVWGNAEVSSIKCKIDFLKNYSNEVVCEDWDVWIFGGEQWVMEKYHGGELVFLE
ncbi:hypothetical protein LJR129_000665 [Acidovorax sp. LjRoot129]|uniref:hypothetical protein n=1 Tax=Acidovorax sp. LjRoot129 TaxID=3342260 RepID=UPI003ECC4997